MKTGMKIKVWLISCVVLLLVVLSACSAEQEKDDFSDFWDEESLAELLDDEVEEVEDYEEEDYVVDVISDPDELNDLQFELKNVAATNLLVNADFEMSLGDRYVRGETHLTKEIVDLLSDRHSDEKTQLFSDLDPYNRPEFVITDPQIIKAVTKNLYQWRDEADAIWLMANQNLPNHLNLFEQRLFSGESNNEGELMYRLMAAGRGMAVLNYAERSLKNDDFSQEDLTRMLDGFAELRETDNKAIQQKIDQLCRYVYKKGIIPEDDYNQLDEGYAFGNPAKTLLELLFDYGDSTVLPIAIRYEEAEAVASKALKYRVRLEGEKHRSKIIRLMKDLKTYDEGLELVPVYYEKVGDNRMLKSAVVNFEILYEYEEYTEWALRNLVKTLVKTVGGDAARQEIEANMENPDFQIAALEMIDIEIKTPEEIASYFFENGLVSEPISAASLEKSADESWWRSDVNTVLEASGIYFWIDSEEWHPLYDNDYLIYSCVKSSQGWLDELEFTIDPSTATEETAYIAVLGNTGYRMAVSKRDEWDYRYISDIIYLMNFILEDQQCDKRFVVMDYDEYIFGEEDAVEQFKRDFRIVY